MSFEIDWAKIKANYTTTIENFLNQKFASLNNLPKFLGPLTVKNLNLGNVPPNVVLKDMMEPFPYFYMGQAPWDQSLDDEDETLDGNSQMDFQLDQASALLNRHLAETQLEMEMDVDSDLENEDHHHPQPHTSSNYHQSYTPHQQSTQRLSPSTAQFPHRTHDDTISNHNHLHSKSDEDIQLLFSLEYDGNISFIIETEIQLNLPITNFMKLPLKFKISGFQFNTNFLIIYLNQSKQIKFTLFDEILISNFYHQQFNLGAGDEFMNWSSSVNDAKVNLNHQLLKNLKIESEIGDPSKQVLKNVDKVEKFILEQTRKIILNHFTYPKFFDLNLKSNNTNESNDTNNTSEEELNGDGLNILNSPQ